MYTHSCSCGASYSSDDPEPFFCEACVAKRKAIAAQVDAKIASIPKKPRASLLHTYDSAPKVRGFVSASTLMGL